MTYAPFMSIKQIGRFGEITVKKCAVFETKSRRKLCLSIHLVIDSLRCFQDWIKPNSKYCKIAVDQHFAPAPLHSGFSSSRVPLAETCEADASHAMNSSVRIQFDEVFLDHIRASLLSATRKVKSPKVQNTHSFLIGLHFQQWDGDRLIHRLQSSV
jgi:hypothetical protein